MEELGRASEEQRPKTRKYYLDRVSDGPGQGPGRIWERQDRSGAERGSRKQTMMFATQTVRDKGTKTFW